MLLEGIIVVAVVAGFVLLIRNQTKKAKERTKNANTGGGTGGGSGGGKDTPNSPEDKLKEEP
jgi:hypothetical protein